MLRAAVVVCGAAALALLAFSLSAAASAASATSSVQFSEYESDPAAGYSSFSSSSSSSAAAMAMGGGALSLLLPFPLPCAPSTLVCTATGLLLVAYVVVPLLWEPLRYDRSFSDMGGTKGQRLPGQMPPPYPSGWYRVLFAFELPRGSAADVELCGRHLVVFRSSDSDALSCLDAYCPHLGANLGIGGRVEGDCIQCPFHGWKFRGSDGKVTEIPYSNRDIPKQAATRAWHVREANGLIVVWFDADVADDPQCPPFPAPQWLPPVEPEVARGEWTMHGSSTHEVAAHIQEMPEVSLGLIDVAQCDVVWYMLYVCVMHVNCDTLTFDNLHTVSVRMSVCITECISVVCMYVWC